jgi:hypothetical protein
MSAFLHGNRALLHVRIKIEGKQPAAEDDPFPPATTPPFFLFCPDRIKHLLRPTA